MYSTIINYLNENPFDKIIIFGIINALYYFLQGFLVESYKLIKYK